MIKYQAENGGQHLEEGSEGSNIEWLSAPTFDNFFCLRANSAAVTQDN